MSEIEEQIAEEMGDDAPDVSPDADGEAGESEAGAADSPGDEAAPAPRSQSDIEAIQKKLEAEAVRHDKRVREIMGDDYQLLVPSPVDWTPGYIFNVEGMRPFPEQLEALDALVGRGGPVDYPEDPGRTTCDMCLGTTKLKTGSLDPIEAALPCRFCQGHGWTGEGNPKIEPIVVPPLAHLPTSQQPQPNQTPIPDAWGRQLGHPHYGIPPAQVGV